MKRQLTCIILMMLFAIECIGSIPVFAAIDTDVLTDGKPTVVNSIFKEDFEDGKIDRRIAPVTGGGTVTETSGRLNITRTSNYLTTGVTYSLLESGQDITEGVVGVEFDVSRTQGKNAMLKIRNQANQDFFSASWYGDFSGTPNPQLTNRFNVVYSEDEATPSKEKLVTTIEDSFKLTLLFDVENSKFSMWINGELLLNDVYSRTRDIGIAKAYIYLEGTNFTTLSLDNIHLFNSLYKKDDWAFIDYNALTRESLLIQPEVNGVLKDNLNLPTSGQHGSVITWHSSHPEVVSENGFLTPAETACEVTLTATVQYGQRILQKEFVFQTLPNLTDPYDIVRADADLIKMENLTEEAPDLITKNLVQLPVDGLFGSIITWRSSNPNAITDRGLVNRFASNPDAVLTATFVCEDEVFTKEYVFKVSLIERTFVAKKEIYRDDFSDDRLDSRINPLNYGGKVTEENGVLNLNRTESGSATLANIYMNPNKTDIRGYIAMEFTLEKPSVNAGVVQIRIRGANGDYVSASWSETGSIDVYCGSIAKWKNVKKNAGLQTRFSLFFDTQRSNFTLLLDGELVLFNEKARVETVDSIAYTSIYLENANYLNLKVDNFDCYYAAALPSERANLDNDWLTIDKLVTEELNKDLPNVISQNLYLPLEGYHLSDISWSSDKPEIISNTGVVNRPGIAYSLNPEVTLTATISSNGVVHTKIIKVRVLTQFASAQEVVQADYDNISFDKVTVDPADAIVRSLNFMEKGLYGSTLKWESSDNTVITQSGRVIRPRVGETDKQVTVRAVIAKDGVSMTRSFDIIVKADEPFTDPDHMSDEDFFGVWDAQTEQWTNKGKLDYSYSDKLNNVKSAVQAGNYERAKEYMLEYVRERKVDPTTTLTRRDTLWANVAVDDIYHPQMSSYFQGTFTAGNEWSTIAADIKPSSISHGSISSYSVIAWHNEASYLEIASADNPVAEYRPRIEVVVNGKTKTYYATEDTTVRAGIYSNQNYSGEPFLRAQMFGKFLSDDTYKSVFKFNFPDILEADSVTSARLILYCRSQPSFSGTKKMLILTENTTLWSENELTWDNLMGYVYNFNGLPEKNHWDRPVGADIEYSWQAARFLTLPTIAVEYSVSKDEVYAYKIIRILEDFIKDKGGWAPSGAPNARGQYPRSLDTAIRIQNFQKVMEIFARSPYMSVDTCTALLKHMWDMGNSIVENHASGGNWVQTEYMGLLNLALTYPEFYDSQKNNNNWVEQSQVKMEELIFQNNFDDGSYIESTGGYNQGAVANYITYKKLMFDYGKSVTPEFDEMLHKTAYYSALLMYPNGRSLQYGDEGVATYGSSGGIDDVAKWYNDKNLEYINSFGAKGEVPDWTSMLFPDSRLALMRSNWGKDTPFMFTNVRGGTNGHGHASDGHVNVYAYGRVLLNDSGRFSYTETDPYRIWGISTRAHNTVEINNRTQARTMKGTINQWQTSNSYDFIRESTKATAGFGHTRNILFVKPNFWIVSDYMKPENMNETNNYKQHWHMLPEAKLSVNNSSKLIRSNFGSGANILVASADKDAVALDDEAWFDRGYSVIEPANAGYFTKDKRGIATFDTMLVPYKDDKNADVKVEKLSKSVADTKATALKFDMVINSKKTTGSYFLAYEDIQGEKVFGEYATDGQLAYVTLDAGNNVESVILQDGSYIKEKATGKIIVLLKNKVESFSMDIKGANAEVISGGINSVFDGNLFSAPDYISQITLNKTAYVCHVENGYIKAGPSTTGAPAPTKESVKNVTDGNPPQSSGGGGNPGGGTPGGGTPGGGVIPTEPVPEGNSKEQLVDIQEHWAKDDIEYLYEEGIVSGRPDNTFEPNAKISRAEFLAIVVRAADISKAQYLNEFQDVTSQDWYSGEIAAALNAGIISRDDYFSPNDLISREEISKILSMVLKMVKGYAAVEPPFELEYSDSENISDWAKEFVEFVSYYQYMKGTDTGEFLPQANATRAEAATVVARLLKSESKIEG